MFSRVVTVDTGQGASSALRKNTTKNKLALAAKVVSEMVKWRGISEPIEVKEVKALRTVKVTQVEPLKSGAGVSLQRAGAIKLKRKGVQCWLTRRTPAIEHSSL